MVLFLTVVAIVTATTAALGQASLVIVQSIDSSVAVTINNSTGVLLSVTARGVTVPFQGTDPPTTLLGVTRTGAPTVSQCSAAACTITQCFAGATCTHDTFVAQEAHIQHILVVTSTSVANWTAPVASSVTVADASALQLWAPWDRGSYANPIPTVDPLQPSDGGRGWWTVSYHYGTVYAGAPDMIVAPQVTLLAPAADVAVSFVQHPDDPLLDMWLNLQGNSTAFTAAGFTFERQFFRFFNGASYTFNTDIVAHAGCWRPSLAWSVARFPTFWLPNNPQARVPEGLGSYSSFLGNLTDASYADMGYGLNWDLSGRFFPYMGMFLPPVQPGEQWLNDPQDSDQPMNITFELIDSYYRRIQSEGFGTLSYFNVFEFGMDIACPAPTLDPPAGNESSWPDANAFLRDNLVDAVLQRAWSLEGGLRSGCIYANQNEIVLNPQATSYNMFLRAQLQRKIDQLPSFQGVVFDRSDWLDYYDLDRDDGMAFVANQSAASLKTAFLRITGVLREMLQAQGNAGIMLLNTLGYSCLSLMQPFDGTFSEGHGISAAGLLGLRTTSIMWTYDTNECCASQTHFDAYMQWRLYLNVFPMAPFPGNDHAILPNATATAMYVQYGALFTALKGTSWILVPHAVVVNSQLVLANAFEDAASNTAFYPVVLGGRAGPATVAVTIAGRAAGGSFAVLYPSVGATWAVLPDHAVAGFTAVVPLQQGCALLRYTVDASPVWRK